jgi:rhodanese-related sulfurtransferase
MTIGLFQLENLIHARTPFLLLDVRVFPQLVASPRVQACLDYAQVVPAQNLVEFLEASSVDKQSPIILFCEDGRLSWSQAGVLESKGYTQVYVVEGGTDGLLREADDLSV